MKLKFVIVALLMWALVGCIAYTTETRTVNPDGTYTVTSETTTEPAGEVSVGAPWVGPATPWVYYNDGWYYNGVLYGYYGGYGWWPYGYYGPQYLVQNNFWYNRSWYGFYNKNPHYYDNFHRRYGNGQHWEGGHHNPGHHGNQGMRQNNHRGQGGFHQPKGRPQGAVHQNQGRQQGRQNGAIQGQRGGAQHSAQRAVRSSGGGHGGGSKHK